MQARETRLTTSRDSFFGPRHDRCTVERPPRSGRNRYPAPLEPSHSSTHLVHLPHEASTTCDELPLCREIAMHPSNQEFMASAPSRDNNARRRPGDAVGSRRVIRSQSHISRLASDESWIEVASQPSSSSLSSTAPEEVITTGLRVAQSLNPRRRRRLRRAMDPDSLSRPGSSTGSSQEEEEYDESDSGSDPVLSRSNLEYQARFVANEAAEPETGDSTSDEAMETLEADAEAAMGPEEDDDDDETALGVADPSPVFTPQPNAFSHPPSSSSNRPALPSSRHTNSTDSYFPSSTPSSLPQPHSSSATTNATTSSPPTSTTISSMPRSRAHTRTRSHTPYSLLQPNHTIPVDHDAALRASLSTLLSCAAAARGLPKRGEGGAHEVSISPTTRPSVPIVSRVEPGSLRLVSESSLDRPSSAGSSEPTTTRARAVPTSAPHQTARDKTRSSKRHHRAIAATSSSPSSSSSPTSSLGPMLSPTLLTWVVGAGVMVLFSALSFSAGYALGRDMGRIEAGNMGVGGGRGGEGGWDFGGGTADVEGGGGFGFLERSTAELRRRVWSWGNASGMTVRA